MNLKISSPYNQKLIMKKVFLMSMASFLTTVIFAQQTNTATTATAANPVVQAEMKDLRKDLAEKKADEVELKEDLKDGNKTDAKEMKKKIREENKDIRADMKGLRKEGARHPRHRACHHMGKKHS